MSLASRLSDLAYAIGTDMKQFRVWMTGSSGGDLTGLTTTDKSNFVAAINEVKAGSSGAPPDASTTVKGVIEIATLAEVAAGADSARAVTPEGVRQERTALKAEVLAAVPPPGDATTVSKGIIEIADLAEVAAGIDASRAVTPAGVRQERQALKDEILGAGVPAALDTLKELADALGDDASYAASITTALAAKVDKVDIGNPDLDLVAVYTAAKA
jgi:hypothetical protein